MFIIYAGNRHLYQQFLREVDPEGNTTLENHHQWWSKGAYTLTSLLGYTRTLKVPLDRANWSDKNDDDFAAAVANVGAVGVSFGGGCFLPTGVAPTDGTASFVLKSYLVL